MEITEKENQIIKDLIFELDSETGSINSKAITLDDINTLIGQLRIAMDNVDEKDVRLHYSDYHRKVRILDELIRYTVNDLNKDLEKLYEIKENLFNEVIRGEKEA